MFEEIIYIVRKIDGDYAYLENTSAPELELKCVARALLPEGISEDCRLSYEMLEYRLV